MPDDTRLTRRSLLVASGAALAGCNALSNDASTTPTFDESALREVVNADTLEAHGSTPAPIARSYLNEVRDRVTDLLSSVPDTLGPNDIPNEAIRSYVADHRDEAREHLRAASEGSTRYEAMLDLRDASVDAANASATLAAARGRLTRDDVLADRPAIRDDVTQLSEGYRYVASDLLSAVVLHGQVESFLGDARRFLDDADESPQHANSGEPLVGATAAYVERARRCAADATHLAKRYRQTIEGSTDHRDAMLSAAGAIRSDVAKHCLDIESHADEPVAQFDAALEKHERETVRTAAMEATWACREHEDVPREQPASRLLALHGGRRDVLAFETIRTSIANGSYEPPTDAAAVEHARNTALQKIESARQNPTYPALTAHGLPVVVRAMRSGDQRLRHSEHGNLAEAAIDSVADYRWAAVRAAALPDANSWLADALEQ